ncbi:ABC transporter substrate-binding protein [Rhizobium sp. CG5]|uniref:branched-chain amino acid ABC transporter substrate-binding protein n=1 Tax=Rhizobium sp. CG5 TaxID=2726076 RepID=UPI002034183A|nr:branched-chain amino acid ABC transporter substrate-binding protein [Rhizobium sp. CG5]MCM2476973.1 ABC transporter substrate-binding protein [Rhizobium sp. CG5]
MTYLRHLSTLLCLPVLVVATPALALTIGVVAPQSGPYQLLGQQLRDGAAAAAAANGTVLTFIDESCEAGSGAAIAEQLKAAKAEAAIGFLCSESLDGALPVLSAAKIPALTLSVRWTIVMEDALKQDWPLFRMAPSTDAEAEKLVEVILRDWPGEAFALIDDGTIHGRELADAIRVSLEERGMKPVFADTYRPGQEQQVALVRRLQKTGATHVFVGGDRNDVAIIARDAASEAIALSLLGGDAMTAANQPVPLADGVRAVTLPNYADAPSAATVAAAFRERGIEPEGYVLPAYAAITLVKTAADGSAASGAALKDTIAKGTFETVLGPIAFTAGHELKDNPYRLLEWRGTGFVAPTPATE